MNLQGSYTYKNSAYAKLETLLRTSPIGSLYDEDGNVNPFPVVGDNKTVNLLVNDHNTYRNNNQNTKIYLNPYIRINPLKGLTFESRLQVSLNYSKSNRFNGIGSYVYWSADDMPDGVSTNDKVNASVATNNSTNYSSSSLCSRI